MNIQNNISIKCGPKTNKRFNELNPTHMGTVAGIRFYEHPIKGDESPLIVKNQGVWMITEFWEVPTIEDLNN